MLVFYPLDFSPVCTDQLSIYQEVLPQIEERRRDAGRDQRGLDLGAQGLPRAARPRDPAAGRTSTPRARSPEPTAPTSTSWRPRNRSLVLIDADGIVRWVHESPTPLEIPGANLIFDALCSAGDSSSATRLARGICGGARAL